MRKPKYVNAIRSCRDSKWPKLHQVELARRCGCTQAQISRYEAGGIKPDLLRAFTIAVALGRPVEAVFFGLHDVAMDRVGDRLQAKAVKQQGPQKRWLAKQEAASRCG